MSKRIDINGQKFGDLTVVKLSDKKCKNNKTYLWECKCTCGETTFVLGTSLRHGHYKSCGCKRIEKRDIGARNHEKLDSIDGTRRTSLQAKLHKGNKSGHKGVMWLNNRNKWKAYIGIKGKQISLGYFDNKEDAIKARKIAEEEYHSKYLN